MPPIYSVPIGSNELLFSPWHNLSALLNRNAIKEILTVLKGDGINESSGGILNEIITMVSQTPSECPQMQCGPLRPAFLGIIPTRICNMSCGYCDFGSKEASPIPMHPSIAISAVDWMANFIHSTGQKNLEIHFFGGEPLVAMDVMEVVIHRARMLAAQMDLFPHFEVSTNGLFGKDVARFVGDYFNAVVVSIDGFENDQNRNRPVNAGKGSFQVVRKTIKRLRQSPTELCLRCCITQESVHKMEEITRWFCEEFQPSVINFETVSENPQSRAMGLMPPEPYLFTKNCVRSRRIAKSFGIQMIYASANTDSVRNSFCPVGRDTLIVSPEGHINSCYLMENEWIACGMDMNVGNMDANNKININIDSIKRLRQEVNDKPGCAQCFCRWNCAGGCHVKHDVSVFPMKYDEFCIQTRLITACFLLDDMQLGHVVDELLNDRNNMEALTLNPNDLVINVK